MIEITDEDRLKDRKVQVRLALAELRRAEKVFAQAQQDLLEFRFRDWEHPDHRPTFKRVEER